MSLIIHIEDIQEFVILGLQGNLFAQSALYDHFVRTSKFLSYQTIFTGTAEFLQHTIISGGLGHLQFYNLRGLQNFCGLL